MQLKKLPKYSISVDQGATTEKSLDLSIPQVMGILNVTPDSFSDGGKFNQRDKALNQCKRMLDQGASIIDIGGESTRPGASPVSTTEEIDRVIPIVEAIRDEFGHAPWLSIDTSDPKVFECSVAAGADIWNDVRALKRPFALQMAAKLQKPIVMMHMRGEPTTMDNQTCYDNIVTDVINELKQRIDLATDAGIKSDNIIVDPGFGFAKNHEQHKRLLNELYQFHQLKLPILFGISRKRFLKEVLENTGLAAFVGNKPMDRDAIGMAAGLLAVQQGVSIIRTHNVALSVQALSLWQQLYLQD